MRERIGHYRLVSQLGAGGMGVVYRAEDERLGRPVAIKVLPAHSLDDDVARQRFRNEARTLCRLSHPNVATLYDFGEADGIDYLVMELIEGETLQKLLAPGPLDIPRLLSFAVQITHGLAAAHEAGIIHRDLKPGNAIVTADGHLKILDFGLAKQVHAKAIAASQMSTDLLITGGVTGTVPYMSPEQLRGDAPDPRVDIYAAGIVLYEMATRRVPFPEHGAVLIDAILNRAPVAPGTVNPHLPPVLDFIILKALEKDPAHRYQTARDLSADLERITAGRIPLTASTSTRLLRRWSGAAVALAGVVLVLLGVWLGTRRGPGPRRAEFVQLTRFSDSAIAPALSPDGRMLAYLHGESPISLGRSGNMSQLWIQMLPDGKAVRLTNTTDNKNWPTFSPDGSRIIYTSTDQKFVWDTWEVPVLGGEPRRMLANASGLTWIAPDRILYSRITTGVHMGIATASTARTDERDIYFPKGDASMAHRSFISPDKKWVLVVEMDGFGWLPCRLVPFDGSSAGHPVGPADSACVAAAWSPDGRWMYFSTNAGGEFHIWRQLFPDGTPEQLTFGPNEEEGVNVAPDGKSLITAVGIQ